MPKNPFRWRGFARDLIKNKPKGGLEKGGVPSMPRVTRMRSIEEQKKKNRNVGGVED